MSCNRTVIASTVPAHKIGCPDLEAFWAANRHLLRFCPACHHFLRRDGGCTHCENGGTAEFPNAFDITARLTNAGHTAVIVGGFLRKSLTGLPPKDTDIATSATPDEVRALFGEARIRSNNGEGHGTVLVIPPDGAGEPIELTTFRLDVETDGRRAVTRFTRDIVEDLTRRDLTVNALAVDPHTGAVFGPGPGGDPTGALADIRAGLIRFVGDGKQRIAEDRLRVLRAIRFACESEQRRLSSEAKADIRASLPLLPGPLSGRRIGEEVTKMLATDQPRRAMEMFRELGLLPKFLPEMEPTIGQAQNAHHGDKDVWAHTMDAVEAAAPPPGVSRGLFRLAMLLHDSGKPETAAPKEGAPGEFTFYGHEEAGQRIAGQVAEKWQLSNADRKLLECVAAEHMAVPNDDFNDAAIRRWGRRIEQRWGAEMAPVLLAAREADRAGRDREQTLAETARIRAVLAAVKKADPNNLLAIGGKDVMQLRGLKTGPAVGAVLKKLEAAVLDNPALNDRETLLAMLNDPNF